MSSNDAFSTVPQPVLSVGELTDQIKGLLEGTFNGIWVAGEISNLSCPQSGHYYLTLKDDRRNCGRFCGARRRPACVSNWKTAWR